MVKKPTYKELEQRVKELENEAHKSMQLAETSRRSEQRFRTILKDATNREPADDELRESEQRYRQLVESARDIIYTVSQDATITSINPAFEGLTGWSSSECIGKHLPSLVHPDDWPLALEMGMHALRGERPPLHEVRILSKSGEYLTGEFSITPFMQKGSVVGILGIGKKFTI